MNSKIKKITCIINRIRPLNVDLQQFIKEIQTIHDIYTIVIYTDWKGHATDIAMNASDQSCDLIIAIGGDGTFNEVINGILNSRNRNTPICLIPNGTGNDFCRAQNINFDKKAMLEALKMPEFKSFDVGLIKQGDKKRYFLNVMDAGFGGYATMLLDRQRSQGIHGGLSYSMAIIRTFMQFRKPLVEVTIDGKVHFRGNMMMVAISNSRSFGNGLIIHPDAYPDDSVLGVTILGNVSIVDYLKNLSNLRKGIYIRHKEISYSTCQALSLKILNGLAPSEVDGEIFGDGNFELHIHPEAINILRSFA